MADFLKLGNIVSPNGASVIYGAESTEDHLNIETTNSETYNPYSIVIVEEDTDENIPADQITYFAGVNSAITSTTAQGAISELEQIIYNSVPVFSQEVWELTANQTSQALTKTFSKNAMMVYYNGLLINETYHYTFESNTISFIGFSAEAGDLLTIIGLAASGSGGANIDAAALIGGSY